MRVWSLLPLVVLLLITASPVFGSKQSDLAAFIKKEGYNKYQPPSSLRFITVGLQLMNLWGVKDKTQFFSCDLVLQQSWKDPRLVGWGREADTALLTGSAINDLWKPLVSFRQAIRVANQDTSDMRVNEMLRINGTGEIQFERRIVADVRCNMMFKNYPFDHQECHFDIILLNEGLDWFLKEGLQLPEGMPTVSEHYTVENATVIIPGDRRLSFRLKLERDTGSFLFLHFIPLFLITGVSLGSLFIDVGAAPARAGLAVTSLLSIITFRFIIQSAIPKVPYLTISGIFVNICIIFVSGNLVLFCLTFWLRFIEKTKTPPPQPMSPASGAGDAEAMVAKQVRITVWCVTVPLMKGADHFVDKWARRCLPALYLLVCVFFFVIAPAVR